MLEAAKQAAEYAQKILLQAHAAESDAILAKIPGTNVDKSSELLPDLVRGADFAALIYNYETFLNNIPATAQICILSKETKILGLSALTSMMKKEKESTITPARPDVVAVYDPTNDRTATIWVIARGTATITDAMADVQWLSNINAMGDLPLPEVPVTRANLCLPKLLTFVETHRSTSTPPRRICFCGHSLGGAIAAGIFLKYHMYEANALATLLVTLGCPQMFMKDSPKAVRWGPGMHEVNLHELQSRVHHVVQQLDIIPRLVGPHSLPEELLTVPIIGDAILKFLKLLNEDKDEDAQIDLKTSDPRKKFDCYGNFYSLSPPHDKRSHVILKKVSEGKALLGAFPVNLSYITAALTQDHSSDMSALSMISLMPEYDLSFEYDVAKGAKKDLFKRRLGGEAPSQVMPKEFQERAASTGGSNVSSAGIAAAGMAGGAMAFGAMSGGASSILEGASEAHKPSGGMLAVSADDLSCPSACLCYSCGLFFKLPNCIGCSGSGGCFGCCDCGYRCGFPTNCSVYRQDQWYCIDQRCGCGSAVPFMISCCGCICCDCRTRSCFKGSNKKVANTPVVNVKN